MAAAAARVRRRPGPGPLAPWARCSCWLLLAVLADLSTASILPERGHTAGPAGAGLSGALGERTLGETCNDGRLAARPAGPAALPLGHIPDVFNMCCSEIEFGDYGDVRWPATLVNDEVHLLCPYGANKDPSAPTHGYAHVKRMCFQRHQGPQWGKSNYEECAKDPHATDDAAKGAEDAERMTADPSNMTSEKYLEAADLISKAHTVARTNRTVAYNMLKAMSNMVAVSSEVQEQADADGSQRRQLFRLMEAHGRGVWMQDGETRYEQHFENLHLLVVRVLDGQSDDIRFAASYGAGNASAADDGGDGPVVMQVPREVIRQARAANRDARMEELRVRFMVVRNAELLSPPGTRSGAQQVVSATVSLTSSATATDDDEESDVSVKDLQSPVRIQLPLDSWGSTHVCAYYSNGTWETEGVRLLMDRDGGVAGYAVCEASHLTPFSLLLDPWPRRDLAGLELPFSIVGYLGSALSVLGLIATILTYRFFSRCGEHRWGRVLVQLCLSLILLHVTFFASNFKGTLPPAGCIAVAILVHTFLLSSFCWMLVEALVLYQMLITVFASGNTKFFLKRFIFAWGTPVLIVTVCGAVDPTYYMDTHSDYCVVSGINAAQHALVTLLPCFLILLTNCFIFIRLAVVLLRLRRPAGLGLATGQQEPPRVTWAQIRSVIGTAFLLGVTWILSPLAPAGVTMQLASSALNSFQGVAIFVSRVLTHPEAGRALRKRLLPKPELRSTSASYSVSDKNASWFRMRWSVTSGSVASPLPPKEPVFSRRCFPWCGSWQKCIPTSRSSSQNAITSETLE